jgi:hypothetical protein
VWIVLGLVAASLALRVTFAATSDVFQDEALHWWEARHPGVEFNPQPPMAALVVRLSLAVLGQGTLALRAGSLVWGTGVIVLAWLIGRDMFGRGVGVWAAAIVACCPLLFGIGSVTGPDSPLVFFWLLMLWAGWRAAQGGSRWWWALCGAAVAAGLYSKYMMVLAVGSAAAVLLATRQGRALLRTPWPWAALVLGVGLFAPIFLGWNVRHEWPALRYHLGTRHVWEFSPERIAKYLGAHMGAWSPLLCVGIWTGIVGACRRWRRGDWRGAWLGVFAGLPILFFLAPSILTERRMLRVQWDEMGYATGAIALAATLSADGFAPSVRRAWRWCAGVGLALGVLTIVAFWVGSVWPGVPMALGVRPPMRQALGWRELAQAVETHSRRYTREPAPLVADSFATMFCVGFHLRRTDLYTLDHERNAQYGMVGKLADWGADERAFVKAMGRGGGPVLYVHNHEASGKRLRAPEPARMRRYFARVEPLETVTVSGAGRIHRSYGLYLCEGWRGLTTPVGRDDDPTRHGHGARSRAP